MTDTPLPEPVAWMIPGDNCRENGFVDVMAWSEGEFTAPLFTRDQLLSALSAERQAREAAEKLARLAYSSDEHHAVWKELLARAETAEARLKEADADVQRLKYENDLLAEGVGLLRERILDAEAVKPIGYLKPRAEWATTPHFVYADEMAEDWQQQVFTIPVYASPPAPHVAEIPEGWVLVPIKPTETMLDMGACCEDQDHQIVEEGAIAGDIWRAMLAAAPHHNQEGGDT